LAELPPHWFSYISVNDIDDRLTNLSDHGGILLRPPFDVDDVGRFAVIQDPSGGVVGWITPSNNA
jgi:predicted enzyme related to lactoylglutathione lyase